MQRQCDRLDQAAGILVCDWHAIVRAIIVFPKLSMTDNAPLSEISRAVFSQRMANNAQLYAMLLHISRVIPGIDTEKIHMPLPADRVFGLLLLSSNVSASIFRFEMIH